MSMRVTEALASILDRVIEPGRRNVTVVTHVQSAAEVTPEMATVVHRLRKHGLSVYNQQVFTTQTSRRFQTVANRIALKRIGVDPYYTFYPKGKDETRGSSPARSGRMSPCSTSRGWERTTFVPHRIGS